MNAQDEILLSLIVARARNGVIGYQGKMPWRIPSELAHFKRTTLGKPVLMGRKTWDSLYVQPLPGRANLVLSRDPAFQAEGAQCFSDFETMRAHGATLARESGASEMVVIGGAMLYALAMPFAQRIYLTEIDADVVGDAHFTDLDEAHWQLSSTHGGKGVIGDEFPYTIKTYNHL
ncbi:MAG: dihydrofolate reductase [Robiginitomaculum sp.]|nr:dihydrofolate reductase [Robiginitomaculum sp.]MDQ7076578.1 dihydrofolate reductase [Robiginitomaculum sp.]